MTIQTGIKNYLADSKATKKLKTYIWEEKTFRSFKRFADRREIKDMEHLDRTVLLDFITSEKLKHLANTTINNKIKLIKRMVIYNGIESNLLSVKSLREKKRTVNDLSNRELIYLFEYVNALDFNVPNNFVYRVMIYFLFDTGVRINECLNIKKKNIDFVNRVIHLEVAKFDKERIIDFSLKLEPMIKRLYDMHVGPYLFWNITKDRQLDYDSDVQWFYRKMKLESPKEFRKITAHRIRHTFASMCSRNGMKILSLKEILGHSDIRTTNVYLHSNRKDTKRDYKKYNPLEHNRLDI